MIPVFITVRDQLTCPFRMFDQVLELTDGHPVLLDNASTYTKTVDLLEAMQLHGEDVWFGENDGNNVAWNRNLILPEDEHIRKYGSRHFVVTDGDIDLNGIPVDLLLEMAQVLDEFQDIPKVSLALRIDDIPDWNRDKDRIVDHESKFWKHRTNWAWCESYFADSDTHFSMYRAGSAWTGYESIRLAGPFTARHTPWYWNPDDLPEDVRWYLDHLNPSFSTWSTRVRDSIAE